MSVEKDNPIIKRLEELNTERNNIIASLHINEGAIVENKRLLEAEIKAQEPVDKPNE